MYGWESEIDLGRAMGRGARAGANRPAHKYDAEPPMMIQVGNHCESNPAYYKGR